MKAAELETLGRRAVACPRWRWMPGMRITQNFSPLGWRLHALNRSEEWRAEDVRGTKLPTHPGEPWLYPDLSDPATLGCLLALAREAHGDPSFVVRCVAGLWYEESNKRALVARGSDTEVEALVAALEAAP